MEILLHVQEEEIDSTQFLSPDALTFPQLFCKRKPNEETDVLATKCFNQFQQVFLISPPTFSNHSDQRSSVK